MTRQNRSDAQVTWYRRRDALAAAGVWLALGGWSGAQAQQRSNVVEFVGDILLNGRRMWPQQTVQTGDQVQTGPGSRLVFVIGNAAFHVRQGTRLNVERGATLNAVSVLHLHSGAVACVFGQAGPRRISTPHAHGQHSRHRGVHRNHGRPGRTHLLLQLLR